MNGSAPAMGNGSGRPAMSANPSSLGGDAPIKLELRGLDELMKRFERMNRDVAHTINQHVVLKSGELAAELSAAGWPSPQVVTQQQGDTVRITVKAGSDPFALEYGTLTRGEKPALRRWVSGLVEGR